MAYITSTNWQTYVDNIATHQKPMYDKKLSPSVQAAYGTYDDLKTAHKTLCAIYSRIPLANINENTACPNIPRGFTVAVESEGTVVEYQYKKTMPVDGYTYVDLELKFSAPTNTITGIKKRTSDVNPITPVGGVVPLNLDADDVTFTANSNSPSNSIGKKIKELAKAVEDNAGSVIEPVLETTLNLEEYCTEGAEFEYDFDTKYVYGLNSNPTTLYTYEDNGDYYAVFKVTDSDVYIVYEVDGSTYTFNNTYTSSTLPQSARDEFELGKYAVIKRITGTAGECWKNGGVSLLCTKDNLALRHRLRNNIMYNGTSQGYCVLVKAEDGSSISIYKANENDDNYYFLAKVASNDANFNYYDKFFDYNGYVEVTNYPSGGVIPTPTAHTYYDFSSTGHTAIDVHNISLTSNYEVVIKFKTHTSSTCTITASTSQQILGSTSLSKNTIYVMAILHGAICICEAPQYVQPV